MATTRGGTVLYANEALTRMYGVTPGTLEQKQRWALPLLTFDKIGAWAMTEPGAGSDAFRSMHTVAVPREDGDGARLVLEVLGVDAGLADERGGGGAVARAAHPKHQRLDPRCGRITGREGDMRHAGRPNASR